MPVINSDKRNKMTQLQMALVLLVIGSGISLIRAPMVLVEAAGQWGWQSIFPGTLTFYFSAYLLIRLMDSYPGKSLVEFLPQLIGKLGTHLFVWFWILTVMAHMAVRIQSFGREMSFFLFDRTPLEVIVMSFLFTTAYGALQDWGALLRVTEIIAFTVIPFLVIFILFGAINMHLINLFPLWPEDPLKVITAVPKLWELFSGDELLIVLFPLVARPAGPLLKYTAWAYATRALLMLLASLATLGVLSAESIKNTTYPTQLMARLAELPGTFLERLDNYLLLSWIPVAYITAAVYFFCIGKLISELYRFSDHRPFVLALLPVMFLAVMSLHDIRVMKPARDLSIWLGLLLAFGAVPLLLGIKTWKDRRHHDDPPSKRI